MILYQLTRPAAYLYIQDRSKWKIDWLLPLMAATLISVIYFCLPAVQPLFGDAGIIKQLQGFLQILPGFYLAALAAIATFNKNDLDFHLPAPTPKIDVVVNGHEVLINLTRRRMLSYLFGYLTFLSLVIYLATVLASIAAPSGVAIFGKNLIIAKAFFIACLNLFFIQMIIVTIFGLYQLCDRIHQPDQVTK